MVKINVNEGTKEDKVLMFLKILNITEGWQLKPADCKLLSKLILHATMLLKKGITKGMNNEEKERIYKDVHILTFSNENRVAIAKELKVNLQVLANSLVGMRKVGIIDSNNYINRTLLLDIDKIEMLIDFKCPNL